MRILITGASGFVGRALGAELARRGQEIVCLTRHPSRADLPFPAEVRAWNDERPLRNIDAAIHLAGESIGEKRWTKAQKQKIVDSRVGTARDLLAMLARVEGRRPRVLVSASGAGYYGDRGDEILTEASPPGETFLAKVCLEWEAAAREGQELDQGQGRGPGLRVVYLRTGIVLGRGGGALAKMLPLFKSGLGGKLGSGRQWMSWIHLDDLVALYLFALENEAVEGPLNAVAPRPVTNAEFTKTVGAQLKVPTFLAAPSFALRLVLGEMSALLLESQRVKSRAESLGFRFKFDKLGEALGAVFKGVEKARGPFFHEFVSRQWVSASPEEIFAVFADPRSLERLSPPELALKVDRHSTVRLRENSVIDYSFRAFARRREVRSVVVEWIENHRYSTTHQRGPFTFWRHGLSCERLGGGTLLTDRIVFRCAGGLLGNALWAPAVEKRLGRFFAFRKRVLATELSARGTPGERNASAAAAG